MNYILNAFSLNMVQPLHHHDPRDRRREGTRRRHLRRGTRVYGEGFEHPPEKEGSPQQAQREPEGDGQGLCHGPVRSGRETLPRTGREGLDGGGTRTPHDQDHRSKRRVGNGSPRLGCI